MDWKGGVEKDKHKLIDWSKMHYNKQQAINCGHLIDSV